MGYGVAVSLRNAAYDDGWVRQVRLPCRVISVGNMTVGGTGKTACVELIARKLIARGRRVAILSRGYRGRKETYWLQWDGRALEVHRPSRAAQDAATTTVSRDGLADEPQLLARHLDGVPIVVGARRDRTGRFAHEVLGVDTVILDDGFQHRRLHRDCELVLIHARMPLSGWALLPRGPMREPLGALRRAHMIIITKADEALELLGAVTERLRALNPEATLVTTIHEPVGLFDGLSGERRTPDHLNGLRVGLLSSLGDPAGFEATVQRLHATMSWHRMFPDHHRYRAADWHAVIAQATAGSVDAIVTTEKDWVRLEPLVTASGPARAPLWVLQVRMKVMSGEAALDAGLDRVYAHHGA